MLRLLALIVLAILIWMAVSALLSQFRLGTRRPARSAPPGADPARTDHLVRCDRCGVRVPASRALAGPPAPDGPVPGRYCSEACRSRGPAD